MKASLVNWLPWSVLKVSGLPLLKASAKALTQKCTSRVLDPYGIGARTAHTGCASP
jgi:hypothetical protein